MHGVATTGMRETAPRQKRRHASATRVRPRPKEDAVRVSARARGRMTVGSEWHLLSSSRLEQAVYEHHPR